MGKKISLLFMFVRLFLVCTVITLLVSGVSCYFSQTVISKTEIERNLVHASLYLESLIQAENRGFLHMQNYLLRHPDSLQIHRDFSGDYEGEKEYFERLFAERNPGQVFDVTISFEELSDEVKRAFASYMFEKWLLCFERARRNFDISSSFYLSRLEETGPLQWVIEPMRQASQKHGEGFIELGSKVPEPADVQKKFVQAWKTSSFPEGLDSFQGAHGLVSALYTPVRVEGKVIGVIGVEAGEQNGSAQTFPLVLCVLVPLALTLLCSLLCLFLFLKHRVFAKIISLKESIRFYSPSGDEEAPEVIQQLATGNDEIASLARAFSLRLLDMSKYVRHIGMISVQHDTEQERRSAVQDLSFRDTLTGIRNKTAYDAELKRLELQIQEKNAQFGIALIDLNFLKRINDIYGPAQGNQTIKKLCDIVCTVFKHSPVFRVGANTFSVLLENDDYLNVDALVNKFNTVLSSMAKDPSLEPWERISAAVGVAFFDAGTDTSVETVLDRAEGSMLEKKKQVDQIGMID